ncbi:MAG: zinc transporter ZupT [Candidatus Heimdallarchaeota archaeon]
MANQILIALLLASLAGLSTTVGSLIAFFLKQPTAKMLSLGLGFSAGVMISVSFLELLPSALDSVGQINAYIAFFIGMIIFYGIDTLVPHEFVGEESIGQSKTNPELLRTGKLTALGVAIHNFPEGLFTFVGTLVSIKIGILLAIAVSMHNIPEGISVSFPIYWATGDRLEALKLSFLSGLAEPLGALIGGVILLQFLNETVLGLTIALVAGIMIFLSFDELLPVAHKHGESHAASIGVISGMIIMVITLILLT